MVVVLTAPPVRSAATERLHGFLRAELQVPERVDLTAAVAEEVFGPARGVPHE